MRSNKERGGRENGEVHVRRPTYMTAAILLVRLMEPTLAWAGMPSVVVSDFARLRLQTFSFFALGLLLSAWGVQRLWNHLRRDFPKLPSLNYRAALGAVVMWGLLFVIVLTMISGARELMTPGAWEKQGLTYRIARERPPAVTTSVTRSGRKAHLERLGTVLMHFAATHDGQFPTESELEFMATDDWQLPNQPGLRFQYISGVSASEPERILAFEPLLNATAQYALFADGHVALLAAGQLEQAMSGEPAGQ